MESQQEKWHDLPTHYEIRRREEEKARTRLLPVMGIVGIVLRELAEHFWFYLPLATLGSVPSIVTAVLGYYTDREAVAWAGLAGGTVSVVFFGAIMLCAYKSITGEHITVREMFRGRAANYISLLKVFFLNGLLGLLVAILRSRYDNFDWMHGNARLLGLILSLIFLFGSLYLEIVLAVTGPACFIENLTVVQSLKRSMHLTRGQRWPIFVLVLVCGIVILVPLLTAYWLYSPLYRTMNMKIAEILCMPFDIAFMTVMSVYIYHRLRTAKEQG